MTNSDELVLDSENTNSQSVSGKSKAQMNLFSLWREDVVCVFDRDPAARSVLEVLTTYPGVHALLIHRLSSSLWRKGFRFLARLLSFFARFFSNVDIHPGATIGRRFFIDHGACVVIGETAEIGDDVTLYHGVTLGGTTWNKGKRHPTLGDGVLVGTGAKILGAITIGQNARVGANSVVVQDVPESSTVVGIPGRIVNVDPNAKTMRYGVDLNHHLIPDPIGKVMSCLLERIDELEEKIEALPGDGFAHRNTEKECVPGNDLCINECSIGRSVLKS